MPTVHVHIVEEEDLRGSKLSCVPGNRNPLPAGATLATCVFFSSEAQLAQRVMQAFNAMLTAADGVRHLFILSAHGESQTGTRIEVAPDETVQLDMHGDLFAMRPARLIIFASACWGGYPSVIRALRARDNTPKPFIVAPIVPVRPKHANELQRRLLDVMTTVVRDQDVDPQLETTTTTFDEEQREEYGEPAFRFVRRNGEMVPAEGEAGLAAPMEQRATYRVVAVQRLLSVQNEAPAIAMVQGQTGFYWRVATSVLSDAQDDAGVYALVGEAFRFRAKSAQRAGDNTFGDLVDLTNVERTERVPQFLRRAAPPYPHACEQTTTKPRDQARTIAATSLRACRRCNWASLKIQSVKRDGGTQHTAEGTCHRDACGEHAKWGATA